MSAVLDDLRDWYGAQCDGDWEHTYGVRIETLDNPGWIVRIDLRETILEDAVFEPVSRGDYGVEDGGPWIQCEVKECQFVGAGDTAQLEEILRVFVEWAKNRSDWLSVPSEEALADRADREFWEALGEEVGPEVCRAAGCARVRIRQSVYCRRHHYETTKGKACPYAEG